MRSVFVSLFPPFVGLSLAFLQASCIAFRSIIHPLFEDTHQQQLL